MSEINLYLANNWKEEQRKVTNLACQGIKHVSFRQGKCRKIFLHKQETIYQIVKGSDRLQRCTFRHCLGFSIANRTRNGSDGLAEKKDIKIR